VASLKCSRGGALNAATKANPKEAEARQGDLHLFFALRAVTYIRQAYLVARHLLLGSLGSLILLLLAVAAFDFQPKAAVLMLLGGALLGGGALVHAIGIGLVLTASWDDDDEPRREAPRAHVAPVVSPGFTGLRGTF